jgi:tRNA A-37 threonylcarbamoyl transferase component Bud32
MGQEATTGLASSLIGTVLSGRYRLESKLGSGGMSTVYLARDETLQRRVAVKVMHREMSDQPDQLERFRREARAVAQLSHPNVVAVIDAGEDGGHPYIVFEHVEGETLKERIDRLGRLPIVEAAAYGIEVGRGLAAAHSHRLIHRDVKPQNVLIDAEGRAKVTDFGIARSLESDGLTKTGRVLGTTDYVAPEQAMGQAVDARCDVYSLGVLLYEMLTGEVPFKADTLVGVAMKHVNEEMPDVQKRCPGVSSALAAVIDRSTAKEPKRRYPDMVSMLADLEGALEVEVARGGTDGQATNVLDAVPRRRRLLPPRRASAAGVLLVLAAVAAALLIAALTGGDESSRGGGAPQGAAIDLAGARTFDPQGDDGEENDEDVAFAIDPKPDTTWTTQTYYNAPELEANVSGKEGVGLIVDAGRPVTGRNLKIRSDTGGWSLEVYGAASGPPTSLEGWGSPIGEAPNMSTDQTVELTATDPSRFYLIWITTLAPGESGGYNVAISDVRLSS